MWVVVKIRVPFWVPSIVRHLLFRVPQKGPLPMSDNGTVSELNLWTVPEVLKKPSPCLFLGPCKKETSHIKKAAILKRPDSGRGP